MYKITQAGREWMDEALANEDSLTGLEGKEFYLLNECSGRGVSGNSLSEEERELIELLIRQDLIKEY